MMDDALVYVLLDTEHMDVLGVYTNEALCDSERAAYYEAFGIWASVQMRRVNDTPQAKED
jgi:hypothetical protein